MNALDVRGLNGRIVLVCSALDRHNPPSGRRGTLIVDDAPFATDPTVAVEVEFPEMFTSRAHLQRFVLSNEEVAQMLASSDYGAMTVRVSGPLNPTVWDTAG